MKTLAHGLSDIGRRREANQDQYLVDEAAGVYAVADGMGGHAAGEVASQIAIDSLAEAAGRGERQGWAPQDMDEAGRWLIRVVEEGNRRICDSVLARSEWRGMGTTLVAMIVVGDSAVIGHIGDSRAYRLRDFRLERLTADHSWVGEQVRLGLLTDAEASRDPRRNIVTRAMGSRPEVELEISESRLRVGDTYLLCSDGLNSMLTDEEIARILAQHGGDPVGACEELVTRANAAGGDDNITVVVLYGVAENGAK